MDNKIYLDIESKFSIMAFCKNVDTKTFYNFVNNNYSSLFKIIFPPADYIWESQSASVKLNRNLFESHFGFWLKELNAVLGYNKDYLLDFLGFFREENPTLAEAEGFICKATGNFFSLRKIIFGAFGRAVEENVKINYY